MTVKIQNIAIMLDEHGFPRENNIAPLTGRPRGMAGRLTNWDWAEVLAQLSRDELLTQCLEILAAGTIPSVGSGPG